VRTSPNNGLFCAYFFSRQSSNLVHYRPVTSQSAADILVKQRLARPVAPHLSIYRPQITWILSSLNRITGLALSGTLYIYGLAYLIGPTVGWHLESTVLAASFAAWPLAAKVATKSIIALPFLLHSFNGVRHLIWDMGFNYSKQQVIRTGWFVVGLTAVGTAYLGFLY
jgi:succinate dehydrogenase (ubiquinone) cytochrome b560 subunit